MPSRKKSSKTAKTTAGKKAEATKSKRTTAKAPTTKAAAKAKTSKVKSVTSASKARTATAKTASAKAVSAKAVAAKTAAAKAAAAKAAAARKAAAAKAASKAKAAAAARTPAKGAGGKPATKAKVATVAKSAKTSVKTTSAKTMIAKAAIAKTVKAPAAVKPAAKPVEVQAKTNSDKNRIVAVSKEATQEKAKQPQIEKAVDKTKTTTATHSKPVEQAGARPKVQLVRSETTAPVAPVAPAPVPVRTAPDPRPASHAPAMQPRETSEQNPVTQKKTISPAAAKPLAKPAAKAPAPEAKPAKPAGQKLGFKTHEHIVYPAHGVGQIVAIEEQEVAGFKLELFVISFVKDKMILKVPTPKVVSVGMRKLAEAPVINKSLDTLTGRARIKRTMWSRRAQEYEAKINSGDLIAIAEVVRDLYRSEAQPEQSYSERQLYEAALDRMSRELAVVQKITEQESLKLIESQLQKGPRRAAKAEAESESDSGEIDEAA
ncbi:MAG: CarD family transcriptional regulator [Hyphomicrobiales bacterium]|nr:CarD family transcriptional regulator [Hyphomicrobiales bacterium]